MKKRFSLFFFALLLYSAGGAHAAEYRIDPVRSEIKFSVRATVYTINGKVKQAQARVSFDPVAKEVKLPLSIEIAVKSLKTRNKLRDRDMQKMFEAEKFPVIIWTASKLTCEDGAEPRFLKCDASGTLKIRDIERNIVFPLELTLGGSEIRAAGSVSINRDDFNLKTPAMLGLIRVSQDVTVEFQTVWIPDL